MGYLGQTGDKVDGSQTHRVERDLFGRQKHMLVGGPRMYVSNIRTCIHQGCLRTGGAAAENSFSLLLRSPTPPQPPPTV